MAMIDVGGDEPAQAAAKGTKTVWVTHEVLVAVRGKLAANRTKLQQSNVSHARLAQSFFMKFA